MATDSLQRSVDPEDDGLTEDDGTPPPVVETLCLPCIDVRDKALPIRPGDRAQERGDSFIKPMVVPAIAGCNARDDVG